MTSNDFMRSLLRPYIDLSAPDAGAPLHVWRPHWSWLKCVTEGRAPATNLQRVMPPAFRESLQSELGKGARFAVRHPAELEPELRTDAWQAFLSLIDEYERLAPPRQAALLATLMSLGFFDLVVELAPMPQAEQIRTGSAATAIAGTVAASRLILALDGLRTYSLDDHILVAENAPPGTQVRFDATLNLAVQCGKWLKDAHGTRHWRQRAQEELNRLCADHGPGSFMGNLLTSRFYRGVSYAPFLEGQRGQVIHEMDICEACALAMEPRSAHEDILKRENMIPMLQSRAKEARWLGDLPLATARLRRACDIDPVDAMRWIELGEALLDGGDTAAAADCYVRAASFAPPGAALAWFMAGECERLGGRIELARAYFQNAINSDPLCVSAVDQLAKLSQELGDRPDILALAEQLRSEEVAPAA